MQMAHERTVLSEHASRSGLIHFLVFALFLVGEMAISFIGGLIIRNPWLPNYLVDRISGHAPQQVAVQKVKAPPPPSTAGEYLNLMNYDEKVLPPNERTVASILNDTVAHLEIRKPPFQLFREQILPQIEAVQPGEDLTKIRTAVQQCQDFANSAIHYYSDISEQLTAKLKTAGLPASTARAVAKHFCQMGTRCRERCLANRSKQGLRQHHYFAGYPLRECVGMETPKRRAPVVHHPGLTRPIQLRHRRPEHRYKGHQRRMSGWRLAVGGWRLAVCRWQFAVGRLSDARRATRTRPTH